MATIIVDSSDSSIAFTGGTWQAQATDNSPASGFYNGTEMVTGTTGGSMTFSFSGTSVSVWTSNPSPSSDFSVKIDNLSTTEQARSGIGALYSSPTLGDGQHLMEFSASGQTGFDFITVAAGSNTPLMGKNLIVDDSDSLLEYSGSWGPGSSRRGSSYLNTTHASQTPGDSVAFPFTGTYVAVYAKTDSRRAGSITSMFSIDGSSPQQYSLNIDGNTPTQSVNTLIFSADNLPAANHVLSINVTGISGSQSLNLDYVVYRAAFTSLAHPQAPSPSQSSPVSAPSTVSNLGSEALYIQHQKKIGVIAGVVISGILLLILAFLLFILWRRRAPARRTRGTKEVPEASQMMSDSADHKSSISTFQTIQTTTASHPPINYHYKTRSSLNDSRPSTAPGINRDLSLNFLAPALSTPYGKNSRPSTAPERGQHASPSNASTPQSPSVRSVTLNIPRKPVPAIDFTLI